MFCGLVKIKYRYSHVTLRVNHVVDRTRWSSGRALSPGVREVVGLIPGRVIPNTLKMVLYASLHSAWHLKDRSRTYGWFSHCRL